MFLFFFSAQTMVMYRLFYYLFFKITIFVYFNAIVISRSKTEFGDGIYYD